jgi:hypothetical protein
MALTPKQGGLVRKKSGHASSPFDFPILSLNHIGCAQAAAVMPETQAVARMLTRLSLFAG